MRRLSLLPWLSVLCVCCTLPSLSAPSRAADKARPTVGVSVLTLANPFFRDLTDAMKDEAGKHGMDVVVTAGEFDMARQRNQVNDFIVRRVDAIVLRPCDSKAIGDTATDHGAGDAVSGRRAEIRMTNARMTETDFPARVPVSVIRHSGLRI